MNEKYLNILCKEAEKAYKNGDVPVGAIITKNNKIISKAYNQKNNKKNAIYHAEILAIKKACKKNKNWRLDDCVLYTTLEPCIMCIGAIAQARIKKIYYILENQKFGYTNFLPKNKVVNHKMEVIKIKENIELKNKMISFFENKR